MTSTEEPLSGYAAAIAAAGYVVTDFEYFGSYQGNWIARVYSSAYPNEKFWVYGAYGSCPGCDAFEAEFGGVPFKEETELYTKFMNFGQELVESGFKDTPGIIAEIQKESIWDMETVKMFEWVIGVIQHEHAKMH